MEIRVQKIISDAGVCSRRKAEELIAEGKVKVNGHPAVIGQKADPYRDLITVGVGVVLYRRRRQHETV